MQHLTAAQGGAARAQQPRAAYPKQRSPSALLLPSPLTHLPVSSPCLSSTPANHMALTWHGAAEFNLTHQLELRAPAAAGLLGAAGADECAPGPGQ
jgi:hypothetical protein